jgi:hypothetical protein
MAPQGSSSSMRLLGQVGSFSKVSFSQAAESRPLSLAVPSSVWITAARFPARSDPAKSQFFLPKAIDRSDTVFNRVVINRLCTRQNFKTPALNHILRAMMSGFCPLTVIMAGGHKNSSNSLNLSSIFWSPCNRLWVR